MKPLKEGDMPEGDATVWGRPDSSAVAKVMWAAAEIGAPVTRIDWGGAFGGNDDQEYRALNPTGRIPTFRDVDGFVLWESDAIIRYLAESRAKGRFYPAGLKARADLDRWMAWAVAAAMAVSVLRGAYRKDGATQTEADAAAHSCAEALAPLEQRLSRSAYVCGEDVSLADFALGVWAHRWFRAPVDTSATPAMRTWYQRLRQRAAFQTHVVDVVSVRPQFIGMQE